MFSCCGTSAVFPAKELQSAPVSRVLGLGKLAASGASYARNSGSVRVAQDCSPPIIGLAIEPKRSETNAEANKRLQDTSLWERIVRDQNLFEGQNRFKINF